MRAVLTLSVLMVFPLSASAGHPESPLDRLDVNGTSPHHFAAYLNWTTNYVYRGISLSNKGPATQASISYQNDNGFFAGWWVSTMDFSPPSGPNTEHNLYLGHSQRWNDSWRTDISATYFNFRGGTIGPDNSFAQWRVAATYADQVTARFYYADNSYGLRFVSKAAELETAYALGPRFSLAGTLGYWDVSHLSNETYFYTDIALQYQLRHCALSLHHHYASSGGRRTYGYAADSGYLLMLAVGF